jgi:hypothetical protein
VKVSIDRGFCLRCGSICIAGDARCHRCGEPLAQDARLTDRVKAARWGVVVFVTLAALALVAMRGSGVL